MNKKHKQIESTKQFRFNNIWLVPIIALFVASWMLYDNWAQKGPVITIIASDADGLQAGKTKVKARNVDVGEVKTITLSDDFKHAVIEIQMQAGTEPLLKDSTQFWVVKPRVGTEGISGLGTILSGSFINMEPGGTDGDEKSKYTMLKQPPLSTEKDQGIRVELFSRDNSKMEIGTPVHFKGFEVGYIEDVGFDIKRSAITYRIFIHSPYDTLVKDNVRFWATPGLQISGTAKGLEVRLDSLQNLISGGITFGEIAGQQADEGDQIADLSEFRLYNSKEEATNNYYDRYIDYIMLFSGSVRGLEPGAPVEYNGIRLGTIKQVPYDGLSLTSTSNFIATPVIPVLIRIEPQRIEQNESQDHLTLDDWKKIFENGFAHGLRATLSTSNMLTGSKMVSIHFVPNLDETVSADSYMNYPVFPTTNDSLSSMQEKVEIILNHLANLPMGDTVEQLNKTLLTTQETLKEIQKASSSLDLILAKENTKKMPDEMVRALINLNTTLTDFQAEGLVGKNIQEGMESVQKSMDELQPLLRDLRQKPNSLIFGRDTGDDVSPKAADK